MDSQEIFKKQQEIMERLKKEAPELLVRAKLRSEKETFEEIGISNIPQIRDRGYIRLHPEDFIVEEELSDGRIIRINEFSFQNIPKESGETLYARLLKIGIPTNVAIRRISETFNILENKIGFSGLKDSDGVTAQLLAFPKLKIDPEKLGSAEIANIYLDSFYWGKGSLEPGSLKGNQFTITVRTDGEVNKDIFLAKLKNISDFGILNYYQAQRFGGLRLLSHKFGKLLLQGEYDLLVRNFLFRTSEYDIPFLKDIRKRGEKAYPDWKKIREIFSELPYSLANEIRLLDHLVSSPQDIIGALAHIGDQTKFWIYAYTSWLFNKKLSDHAYRYGCIDEEFPLLSANEAVINGVYKEFLIEDGTLEMKKNLTPFKFIKLVDRKVKGRIFPKVDKAGFFAGGTVLSFSLSKGAYATTFLANLFELFEGLPCPDWVDHSEIDPKALIGQGEIIQVRKKLSSSWYSKADQYQN